MELSGKVIIFKDESEAELWFKTITEVIKLKDIKQLEYEMKELTK